MLLLALTSTDDPISTIIPAHGYRIIWCDKEDGIWDLHAPFKLENEDQNHIILSASDGSWHDTLTYCSHLHTETVGRYPDASRNVYRLTRSTIEKTNQYSSYSTPYAQPTESAIQQILPDDVWDNDYIVYNMSGSMVCQGHGPLSQKLPSGVYIVRSKGTAYKVMVP